MTTEELLRLIEQHGWAKIRRNESMKSHTTFRCESVADALIYPLGESGLQKILELFHRESYAFKTNWDIIGRGSNLLIRDGGFKGILIDLVETYTEINLVADGAANVVLHVGAGVANGKLLQYLREKNLAGFGFSFGIPGCIGGGIRMNAGTPLGWFSHVVVGISGYHLDGQAFEKNISESDFTYRDFPNGHKLILTGARMKFVKSDSSEVEKEIEAAKGKRANQPLEFPNVGSVFKNPPGTFAAKLIEASGFKGKKIGDAQVSPKHSNFIVNMGKAKTSDVVSLMSEIQGAVLARYHVQLEPEVKFIGVDV